MTTRTLAAVAEQLSLLADEMSSVAGVLFASSSRVSAHPHLFMLCLSARRVSLTLRMMLSRSDDAMHLAGEIDSWRECWSDWRYLPQSRVSDFRLATGMEYAARFVDAKAQELRA